MASAQPPSSPAPDDTGGDTILPLVIAEPAEDGDVARETVEHPAKVMRIASMIRQLLDEVRQAPLDEASRNRLREIYQTSVTELSGGLSPDLRAELGRVSIPFADNATPTESELRIAQAQLVGWLEGLFHGIQATMFAQQMAARVQTEEMGQRGLPPAPASPGEARGPMRPPGYL